MKTPKSEGRFLDSLSLNSNEVGCKLAVENPSCHHPILVTIWFVDLSILELDESEVPYCVHGNTGAWWSTF